MTEFKTKVEEVRTLFRQSIAGLVDDDDGDEAAFVTTEEIAGPEDKWEFAPSDSEYCLYGVLSELGGEFDIEEDGGGFYVSEKD